jgi:hypothetical protein
MTDPQHTKVRMWKEPTTTRYLRRALLSESLAVSSSLETFASQFCPSPITHPLPLAVGRTKWRGRSLHE